MSGMIHKLFWLLLFVTATFCWYVLFEHGLGGGAYFDGLREEWRNLTGLLRRQEP